MRATPTPWMPCSLPTWWTTTQSRTRCPALPGSSSGCQRPGAAFPIYTGRSDTYWPRASWSPVASPGAAPRRDRSRGVAPTGQFVVFEAYHIARFKDGKVVEWWGTADVFGVLAQLGAPEA